MPETQSAEEIERLAQETNDFLNQFIQIREVKILLHNNLNLHSYNSLDIVRMILKFSNSDFDFEPLMTATEHLLFKNSQLRDWVFKHHVQNFDDIHLTLAALFYVCHEKGFDEFANNLNIFMTQ